MAYPVRWIIIVLSFFGIADSAYLAQHTVIGSLPSCSFGTVDGCRIVAESAYSHLFGIPLGVYGVVFYGLIFVLAALSLIIFHIHITRSLRVLAVIGATASVVFICIQVFIIGALCMYCETSAILSFLILIAVWLPEHLKTYPNPPKPNIKSS